jgi:hypothetical protein
MSAHLTVIVTIGRQSYRQDMPLVFLDDYLDDFERTVTDIHAKTIGGKLSDMTGIMRTMILRGATNPNAKRIPDAGMWLALRQSEPPLSKASLEDGRPHVYLIVETDADGRKWNYSIGEPNPEVVVHKAGRTRGNA